MGKVILVLIVLTFSQFQAVAQCTGPTPSPSAACTGTLLTDGAVINTGNVYYYDGGPATFNNVSLNGGLLRICGTLTIVNLSFNEGRIVIEPTGNLSFGGSIATLAVPRQLLTNYGTLSIGQNYQVNSDSYLINFGTVNMNTATSATGTNAFVVNELQGTINMNAFDASFNSVFINKGRAAFRNVIINASGSICMSNGSGISMQNLTSDLGNSVSVESGIACLSYSGTALINAPLTSSAGLSVCRLPGSQDPFPSNFGAAQVVNPCTSCEIVLPVKLTSFSATLNGLACQLEWTTASEDNVRTFVIENSSDGQHFAPSGQVFANNRPSSYSFLTTLSAKTFFRLKIYDIDGRFEYSNIILADPEVNSLKLSVFPNPVKNGTAEFSISSPLRQNGEISLIDMNGRLVYKKQIQLQRGVVRYMIPVYQFTSGIYPVYFKTDYAEAKTKLIIAPQ